MNILIHLLVFITFINHLSPPTVAILIAPLTIFHSNCNNSKNELVLAKRQVYI